MTDIEVHIFQAFVSVVGKKCFADLTFGGGRPIREMSQSPSAHSKSKGSCTIGEFFHMPLTGLVKLYRTWVEKEESVVQRGIAQFLSRVLVSIVK
ncbi:hypothetical protein BWQ96_04720 [Gracilariopsis chorda]|uniref:Uncharacterized protein n=1 Tax=Gracilariopsis chorda TaxID=448386 RepID=A0A2V3ITR0_9FLOR|nr:hypothetical protein BWQ96_04720 [Gracilariopsis chorda]|eukprot:PXF45518.1 hypothetical protein BWQ96_04720 [Gracilariopsis chorda]